jgi:hypothetical protein
MPRPALVRFVLFSDRMHGEFRAAAASGSDSTWPEPSAGRSDQVPAPSRASHWSTRARLVRDDAVDAERAHLLPPLMRVQRVAEHRDAGQRGRLARAPVATAVTDGRVVPNR